MKHVILRTFTLASLAGTALLVGTNQASAADAHHSTSHSSHSTSHSTSHPTSTSHPPVVHKTVVVHRPVTHGRVVVVHQGNTPPPNPPFPGAVWVPGQYGWNNRHWVWIPGHWSS